MPDLAHDLTTAAARSGFHSALLAESAGASEHDRWRVIVRNINTRRRDVVDDVQRAFAIIASNLNAAVVENDGPEQFDVEPSNPEH